MTITIQHSPTADTRTCDVTTVSKEMLREASAMHIRDVGKGIALFQQMLTEAAVRHDTDKLTDIDGFYADFQTKFAQTSWWDRHRQINRHHLLQADGVRDDVNLIDVLDMIADCVMAGMARAGSVYPLAISDEVLRRAFEN